MTLIEGIGDEVTHFFIGLIIVLVVLIVTIAWWTTSISEHRHTQTVWLLDRRRIRRLTNHTQTVTINEGVLSSSSVENINEESSSPANTVVEAETVASVNNMNEEEEEEQNQIVETMDSDATVLRQRRLAFYDNLNSENDTELSDNSQDVIMEHNYASRDDEINEQVPITSNDKQTEESEIRIKLKYINDDLKLVNGKLQELLGDFKQRHFHEEITSNKLVRLIFNGQVLDQDSRTLQGCGFFDNCVVHCLIHQKRNVIDDSNRDLRIENISSTSRNRITQSNNNNNNNNNETNMNNNNQGRDWDLGNFLFMIITFTLLSAWYFRYVYAHLYTVTATIGLMLMTAVFTIFLIGMRYPDQEQVPPRRENTLTL